ncbi:hypothetical protein EDB83DRAFT_2516142 [Lactarius deliciosus]|nr:hypothetical protein EDB83DRAFT_2516142 [Lactarius deliciosus]
MRGKNNTAGAKPKPWRPTTGKQSKKLDATPGVSDDTPETVKKGSRVQWDNLRTERLVDWLEDNPEDRQKLFSDSSHDAKNENRPHHVAKGSKSVFYIKMAKYIFSVDGDVGVHAEVKEDVKKYSKAVENRITNLKHKYCEFTQELGRTGAGLTVEEIRKDSNLSNILDKLLIGFPAWERLHGFWRTLPSFNPHAVSSEPGQDLESEAIGVLFGNKDKAEGDGSVGDQDEPDGLGETDNMWPDGEEEHAGREVDNSEDPTPGAGDELAQLAHASSPVDPKPFLVNHCWTPSVSSSADQSSKSGPATGRKVSSKHSRIENSLEASASENAKLLELAKGSYDFKTAHIATKRQKMVLRAEHEREAQWYAAEERALLIKERMQDKKLSSQEQVLKYELELARLRIQQVQHGIIPPPALGSATFPLGSGGLGNTQVGVYTPDNFNDFAFPPQPLTVAQSPDSEAWGPISSHRSTL